jgi:hypothetical protein
VTDVEELDRFLVEGGVLVPGGLIGELLGRLRPLVTAPGPRLSRDLVELLQALAVADLDMSARGPRAVVCRIVDGEGQWITAPAAAQRVGCERRHITRLALSRRITARKAGRDWLISVPSLDNYFRGAPDERSAGDAT